MSVIRDTLVSRSRRLCKSVGVHLLLLGAAAVYQPTVHAAIMNFAVNTTEDEHDANPGDGQCAGPSGACSLRAAFEEVGVSAADGDHIYVGMPSGRYFLEHGPLLVLRSLTLSGSGANQTVIDAAHNSRAIEYRTAAGLTLSKLTLTNGFDASSTGGGAVRVPADSVLAMGECIIENSTSHGPGGGVLGLGTLMIVKSTIRGNRSVSGSDESVSEGGGLYLGAANIYDSSIVDNSANHGGGISNHGNLQMSNTTISGNRAGVRGGGIFNQAEADDSLLCSSCTIVDNVAGTSASGRLKFGGGIYNAGQMAFANTILACNSNSVEPYSSDFAPDLFSGSAEIGDPDGGGVFSQSLGGSIIGVLNPRANLEVHVRDQVGTAISPLSPGLPGQPSIGAGTVTSGYEPLPGSVAIDAAYTTEGATCPSLDQWWRLRENHNDHCDVGAIESGAVRVEVEEEP